MAKKTTKAPTVVLEPPLRAPPLRGRPKETPEPAMAAETQEAPTAAAVPTRPSETDLNWMFDYHKSTGDQINKYDMISEAAKNLARVILEVCPPCADRSAAIRKVREARATANASIALHGQV